MTISKRVQRELARAAPPSQGTGSQPCAMSNCTPNSGQRDIEEHSDQLDTPGPLDNPPIGEIKGRAWTQVEHERFLQGLKMFPSGPWKAIAAHIGTKNSRQTMTHAQKYRQKFERRLRGLRPRGKKPQSREPPAPVCSPYKPITSLESDGDVNDESSASNGMDNANMSDQGIESLVLAPEPLLFSSTDNSLFQSLFEMGSTDADQGDLLGPWIGLDGSIGFVQEPLGSNKTVRI